MFTVKATYKNETRKFSFPETTHFPSYDDIYQHLFRVFPVTHSSYFSKLIFSPDASKPSRILISQEVHTVEQYKACITPMQRLSWPNALLRFFVYDENSRKSVPALNMPPCGMVSPAVVPPPPIISSSFPNTPAVHSPGCIYGLPTNKEPVEVDTKGSQSPCCPVAKGKADIQNILSTFKQDLDSIISTLNPANALEAITDDLQEKVSVPAEEPKDRSTVPQHEHPSPVLPDTSAVEPPKSCFVCRGQFQGIWYGCLKCTWHSVCPTCFRETGPTHTSSFGPSHVVTLHSTQHSSSHAAAPPAVPETNTSRTPAGPSDAPIIHRNIVCDACQEIVIGVRHKCLDCADYDLCATCMDAGSAERHNPFHSFVDIEKPERRFRRSAPNHRTTRDPAPTVENPPVTHSAPSNAQVHTSHAQDVDAERVLHTATCNLCDSPIEGARYKCLNCPDFDTCATCFGITTEQHPDHGFVKVDKPENLMMRNALHYPFVKHYATCDSCRRGIDGVRYKCMHPDCPDYDLCADCEALPIPVHPSRHPLLMMKTIDTVIPMIVCAGQRVVDQLRRPETIPKTPAQISRRLSIPRSLTATPLANDEKRLEVTSSEQDHTRHTLEQEGPVTDSLHSDFVTRLPSVPKVDPLTSLPAKRENKGADATFRRMNLADILGQSWVPTPLAHLADDELPILSSRRTERGGSEERRSDENVLGPIHGHLPDLLPVPVSPAAWSNRNPFQKDISSPVPAPSLDSERDEHSSSWSKNDTSRQSWLTMVEQLKHLTRPEPIDVGKDGESKDMLTAEAAVYPWKNESNAVEEPIPGIISENRTQMIQCNPSLVTVAGMHQSNVSSGLSTPSLRESPVYGNAVLPAVEEVAIISPPQPSPPKRRSLSSAFLTDTTVPEGQIFPPGAEFVKSWRLINDGEAVWPETTEIRFVAGESFACNSEDHIGVGIVYPGQEVDVWTGDLKAPDAPGRYVSYWHLSDGLGNNFGCSIWIDIIVVEHTSDDGENSLASSSIIMPGPSSEHVSQSSTRRHNVSIDQATSVTSKPLTVNTLSDDDSSFSLISGEESDDGDSAWQDTRSELAPGENRGDYVVLYASSSDSD